jgi:hypothetical protein
MKKLNKIPLNVQDFIVINNAFSKVMISLESSIKKLQQIIEEKDSSKLMGSTKFEDIVIQVNYLKNGIKQNKIFQKNFTIEFWKKHGKSTIGDKFGIILYFDKQDLNSIINFLKSYQVEVPIKKDEIEIVLNKIMNIKKD